MILRAAAPAGKHWVRTIWNWSESVASVTIDDDGALTTVTRLDGSADKHGQLDTATESARAVVGTRSVPRHPTYEVVSCRPLVIELGGESYRRSEESWDEAGRPTARITVLVEPNELRIDVAVRKSGELTFVLANAVNRYDNESPDINGDGMQLFVHDALGSSAWVITPEIGPHESRVRTRLIDEWPVARPLQATWRRTDEGYALSARLPIAPIVRDHELALGLVVNEKPPDRERRRGQLVLGGAGGEFVYLRGDREALDRLPRLRVTE